MLETLPSLLSSFFQQSLKPVKLADDVNHFRRCVIACNGWLGPEFKNNCLFKKHRICLAKGGMADADELRAVKGAWQEEALPPVL